MSTAIDTANATEAKPAAAIPMKNGSQRLEALDVFRGLTIAAMILVNDPGTASAMYWPLDHADEWMTAHPSGWYPGKWWIEANRWTPTDLVFPFFLLIVGVSMVLSFSKRQESGDSRQKLMLHAGRRSAVIFAIGWLIRLQPFFDFTHMRWPGVLPRIAVVYLFASLIALWSARRARILWIAGLLIGYYLALRLIPVPGCDQAAWATEHCSLAGWVDRKLMLGHLYRPDFDPEGLLSTLPAIATTLLGTLVGDFLRSAASLSQKIRGLALAGVLSAVAGYAWHPFFPISKPLWSSSYVLFTAGAGCLLLALCLWLIDARGWRVWERPFLWLGSNAILAYALSVFFAKEAAIIRVADGARRIGVQAWIYLHWFAPFAQPNNASLAFAILYTALWTAVAWGFYRKRIFVKV
ncbi:MAG TPA: heparan-alpha-glucosaminide N-acetyltransferase domain-containing protein [Candidatus Angelobacter sp.]|nr:heparan-alpha-glucosaminide N-acetyltransferase domain-containing protein [Candidatus Angelobacter sp.]